MATSPRELRAHESHLRPVFLGVHPGDLHAAGDLRDLAFHQFVGLVEREVRQLRRGCVDAAALVELPPAWQGSGDVSFELEPKDGKVLLTVTHRSLPSRDMLLKVAAGWHMHLDILVAHATSEEPAPFWPGWVWLERDYDKRIPA